MHLRHHEDPHTPPIQDGFAPDDPTQAPFPTFEVIHNGHDVAHDTGSLALRNFVLLGQNPPLPENNGLRVVPHPEDHIPSEQRIAR